MVSGENRSWILERARSLGFDLCGVAALRGDDEILEELARLPEWLARGYAGEMTYLADPRRADPRRVLEGVRSLIVVAMNYYSAPRHTSGTSPQGDEPRGWISRYAWGDDYHDVLGQKLTALSREMRARFSEPFEARAYVDTGPILERVAAKYAGLGWLGKNTCLINSQLGSWLFLGVILTTLDLEPTLGPGQEPAADLCGTCTRCLDACPTDAFPEPYVLDARRCISYLTIELRGSIPAELRPLVGNAAIGCDICQDVCPWNRKAPLTTLAAFKPRQHFLAPELGKLAALSEQEFRTLARRSAAKRAKWRGLVRNASVALGNSAIEPSSPAYPRIVKLLETLAASADELLAEHANWALSRLRQRETPPQEPDCARLGTATRPPKTE
jgi:epoxyqueuosine reductase